MLYIFADGIQRIQPKLIFHGKAGPTGDIFRRERHLYSNEITVAFNNTAYNNKDLFETWIDEEYCPILTGHDNLLVMDVATFHKTPSILKRLRENHVMTAFIPSGCTSLLQPLDTAVNKPFKGWLREATEEYMDKLDEGVAKKWTVSERRVMTTFVVAAAARKLAEKASLVQKAFIECGISILPDGSQDHLINVKDIPSSDIDFTGWETQEAPTIMQEEEDDFTELSQLSDSLDEFTRQGEDYLPQNCYRRLLAKELKENCKGRGLPVSGAKIVLIERLEKDDRRLKEVACLTQTTEDSILVEQEAPSDSLDEFTRQGEDHLLQNCYQRLLAKELKENCRGRGLPVTGVKMVLIERLEKDDRRLKEVAHLTQDQILVEQEVPTIMQEEGDDFAEVSQASDTIDEFTRQAEDYLPQTTIGGFSLWSEDGSDSEDGPDGEDGEGGED